MLPLYQVVFRLLQRVVYLQQPFMLLDNAEVTNGIKDNTEVEYSVDSAAKSAFQLANMESLLLEAAKLYTKRCVAVLAELCFFKYWFY